jgi:Protein of unknown function (DUF2950)
VRFIRSFMAVTGIAAACALAAAPVGCTRAAPTARTFSTPEDAVRALTEAVKAPGTEQLLTIFGPDLQDLVDTSEPAGRRAREVFTVAVAERWRLEDQGSDSKTLVIGNEDWPFPIPITRNANGWRFDTAKGKDEVLTRRIGRNELAAIAISRTYVTAQRLYARRPHDGKPAGLYATAFRSEAGRQNGLYWPAKPGEKRSPLGDLVAQAAEEGIRLKRDGQAPSPFHGYYFRILTAQGAAAEGGAKDYLVNGEMKGGFALVAWPAQYSVTGITTFVVNQNGVVREKDLGPGTDASARAMTAYNADESWDVVP